MAHGLSDLPSAITLRPVTASERDFLVRVYASTREEELAPVPWTDAEKAAFVEQQFEAQDAHYRTYPDAAFDLIEVDREPAGRLYVARWREEIRIMDVALLPEYRSRGIGTKLLRALLGEAAATGKRLTIHVEKFNPARSLYERLGFSEAADRGVYVLLEATPAPDWTDVNRSDPGITLLDLFAFLGERLGFSLGRRRHLLLIAVAALAAVGFVWRRAASRKPPRTACPRRLAPSGR